MFTKLKIFFKKFMLPTQIWSKFNLKGTKLLWVGGLY